MGAPTRLCLLLVLVKSFLCLPFSVLGTYLPSVRADSSLSMLSLRLFSLSPRCAALSLPSRNLVIWIGGFVSFFGIGGSGILANCSLCCAETSFFLSQAQFVQVVFLNPVFLCKLSASLGNTNKSVICSFSSETRTRPLLRFSFYLRFSGTSGRNCPLTLSFTIWLQWTLRHYFFRVKKQ